MQKAVARLALVVLGTECGQIATKCLVYGDAATRIEGQLVRRSFAGPPNYESIASGDADETGFYLVLPTPICARPSTSVNDASQDASLAPRDSITLVQLGLDSAGYAALRPLVGGTVRLTGSAFSAFTGHHHAPIVLQVAKPVKAFQVK